MALISIVVLALASLFGYSLGAVVAGRRAGVAPRVIDLFFLAMLWSVVISARGALGRWLAIPVGLAVGALVGATVVSLRLKIAGQGGAARQGPLLKEVGNFQSRLLISLLYFTVFSVPGVIVRVFRDPLALRRPPAPSAWIARRAEGATIEESKRQF